MTVDTTGEPDASVAEQPSAPRWANRPRLAHWVACVALALACIGLVAWQVPRHVNVSPIDEYVYIDYLAKVPTQGVVHRGEQTGEFSRHYLACHGVRMIGLYPHNMCQHITAKDVARLPNAGKTSADLYTPLYFGVTWVLAQPLVFLGVDLVSAGRYVGAVWLAAAAILLFLSLRRLRIGLVGSFGVGLLLIGSLGAYWSNTYVSTDASALLAGSLMIFGVTKVLRGERFAITWFAGFAVIASLLKLQNLMAVAAASLALLIFASAAALRSERGRRFGVLLRDHHARAAIAGVVAGVLAQGVWVVVRSAIAVGTAPDQGVGTHFGRNAFIDEVFKFFPGVTNGAYTPQMTGSGAVIVASIGAWLVVGGVVGLLAASRNGSIEHAVAAASLALAVSAGPILAVANIAVSGFYFTLPARYGLSLLPFFLLCAAFLFARKKWLTYSLPVLGLVSYAAVMTISG